MEETAVSLLIKRILKWLTYLVQLSFIVMGIGIMSGYLLGGSLVISGGRRMIFGGVILVYGVARLVMLYRRDRRAKNALQTQDKNGSYKKKSLTM